MKKFYLIFLFLLIVIAPCAVQAQECQKLLIPNEGEFRNISLIRIDSCPGSNTYNQLFVKTGVLITMSDYIFSIRPISTDTVVNLNAIDSSYDSVKTAFENLQSKFGTFTFRRFGLMKIDSEFICQHNWYYILSLCLSLSIQKQVL